MQQGGSQYGVSPEMPQAPPPPYGGPTSLPEAASPISSRPPAAGRGNFDELGLPTGGGGGGFPEEDVAEEVERGVSGNRWPRQETLALLKIRSEMDAVFRDATLKGPLWEEVSRKLAELGYSRSAKKCKEKFENVHKYYKRTKEGRAGRQDGKSYKFFSQLEALHSSSNTNTSAPTAAAPVASVPPVSSLPPPPPPPVVACPPNTPPPPVPVSSGIGGSNTMVGSSGRIQPPPPPVTAIPPPVSAPAAAQINVSRIGPDLAAGPSATGAAAACGISFSSNSSSSSSSGSEDETEEGPTEYTRKRKRPGSGSRGGGGGGSGRKMMAFFEGLMKEVIERQEAMQQRFLEAIEKREQDRMIREEAWKRQEMARLTREHEMMVQERAMAASRDAAVMAFLQKMTGQTIQIAQPVLFPVAPAPQATTVLHTIPPPPQPHQQHHHHHLPPPQQHQPQQVQHQHQQHQSTEIVRHFETDMVDVQLEQQETGVTFETTSSSRWPKSEVIALIKMRTGLDSRYQEAGPKGPLWEEISAGMQRLGFNRSSKRCKEKWENINKYFKKVKESNKKRPEDAKTCPYFHHLDALYRKKLLASSSSGSKQEQEHSQNPNRQEKNDILAIMPPPPPQPHPEVEIKSTTATDINKNGGNADGGGSLQVQSSNGGLPSSFFEGPIKKPEDIVKEMMELQQQQQSVMDDYDKLDEPDSDNLDQEEEEDDDEDDDDEDEEEEEEDSKMAYEIQFQRPNAGPPTGGANAAEGSFLAMVQKLSSS